MARYLFAPIPFTGHINPGLPIAAELVRRGHEVRWYTTPRFQSKVEAVGATCVPYRAARVLDEERLDELFPDREQLKGIAQIRYDLKTAFIDPVPGMFRDLRDDMEEHPADVVVGDNCAGVCPLLSTRFGVPWAVYGVSVFLFNSVDAAPFGAALLPMPGRLGRLRNRSLTWLNERVLFRCVAQHLNEMRRTLGFTAAETSLFDFTKSADLYLQSGVPSFEYPRSDLPNGIHFIGATVPEPPVDWRPPHWWPELDGGRPVILVTQGTIANDYDDLIRPAIRALAKEDAFVVATTGSRPPEAVEIDPLPANVRVEKFVPYAHLMPKVDLLLTNGGFGSVMIALRHGVPLVVFGGSEEKPEIANRVAWSGVGRGARVRRPSEEQIRSQVRAVLGDPRYRARARALQAELESLDASRLSGDLLEDLARSRTAGPRLVAAGTGD